jgi:hypothetical protein
MGAEGCWAAAKILLESKAAQSDERRAKFGMEQEYATRDGANSVW